MGKRQRTEFGSEELHLSRHNDPQTAVPLHSGFWHHVGLLDSQSQVLISSMCVRVLAGARGEMLTLLSGVGARAHTGVPGLHAEHTHKVFFIVTVASSDTAKVDEVHTR